GQFIAYTTYKPTTTTTALSHTFVCVAGLGETRHTYRHLAPLLADAGHMVLTVDLRGMGHSSTGFSSFSVEACTSDIESLLEHKVGADDKVVMVGNSFAAACIVLLQSPKVVASAILGPFVRDLPGVGPKVFNAIAPAMFARPYGASVWMSYWKTLFGAHAQDFAAYEAFLKTNIKEQGRLRALVKLVQASKANAGSHLHEYKLPMLIGMGSADPDFACAQDEAHYIHDTIASTTKEVVMFPNMKHYPQAECPAEVATSLTAFLAKVVQQY
ncbi:hypothetical protein As57867_002577, partial [Aphanomyces stellatus]